MLFLGVLKFPRRVRRHTTFQSGDFADHQVRGAHSACDVFGEAAVEDLFAFNILGSQAVDGTAVASEEFVRRVNVRPLLLSPGPICAVLLLAFGVLTEPFVVLRG